MTSLWVRTVREMDGRGHWHVRPDIPQGDPETGEGAVPFETHFGAQPAVVDAGYMLIDVAPQDAERMGPGEPAEKVPDAVRKIVEQARARIGRPTETPHGRDVAEKRNAAAFGDHLAEGG